MQSPSVDALSLPRVVPGGNALRNALTAAGPSPGMFFFNFDTDHIEQWVGDHWETVGAYVVGEPGDSPIDELLSRSPQVVNPILPGIHGVIGGFGGASSGTVGGFGGASSGTVGGSGVSPAPRIDSDPSITTPASPYEATSVGVAAVANRTGKPDDTFTLDTNFQEVASYNAYVFAPTYLREDGVYIVNLVSNTPFFIDVSTSYEYQIKKNGVVIGTNFFGGTNQVLFTAFVFATPGPEVGDIITVEMKISSGTHNQTILGTAGLAMYCTIFV